MSWHFPPFYRKADPAEDNKLFSDNTVQVAVVMTTCMTRTQAHSAFCHMTNIYKSICDESKNYAG